MIRNWAKNDTLSDQKRKLLKERLDFPINPNMILILSGFSFKNECVLDIAAIPYNLKCRHSLSQERYDCNSARLPSTAILMKYTQSSFFKNVYCLLLKIISFLVVLQKSSKYLETTLIAMKLLTPRPTKKAKKRQG